MADLNSISFQMGKRVLVYRNRVIQVLPIAYSSPNIDYW